MTATVDLTTFKALSFDCYGTLIDWEAGITAVLRPVGGRARSRRRRRGAAAGLRRRRGGVERENPTALYPDGPGRGFPPHRRRSWDARSATTGPTAGRSVPDWPAFPTRPMPWAGSPSHYQLIIVSNVHRAGFAGSNEHLHGDFAAIITAEDVGAYKPAENHFRALDATLPRLGVDRISSCTSRKACSTTTSPPNARGCRRCGSTAATTAWGARPSRRGFSYNLEFTSMAAFADAVDAAFAAGNG